MTTAGIWYGDLVRPGGYHARVIWTPRGSVRGTTLLRNLPIILTILVKDVPLGMELWL